MSQKFSVFADQSLATFFAAGCDKFGDGNAKAAPPKPIGDRASDDRLADAGVGAGDEKAGDGDGI